MSTIHYSLHPAQRDIFIDQVMNPESLRYSQGCYLILNALDKDLFLSSVEQMLSAHDVFRMQFDQDEPESPAILMPQLPPEIFIEKNFSNESEEHILTWMEEQLNVPILLKPGHFPHQHYLLKINEDTYWYFMRYHHIILDGVGLSNWFKDVAECYRKLNEGASWVKEIPSYASIMKTADDYYKSSSYEETKQYWKQKFNEPLPSLLEKKYPISGEESSGIYTIELNQAQLSYLNNLQKSTGVGLSALSLAVLHIYLGQVTREQRFALGLTLHKRRDAQERSSAGMFSGVLPFSCQYDQEKPFYKLIEDVITAQKESYPHYRYMVSDFSTLFPVDEDRAPFEIIVNHGRLDYNLDFGHGIALDLKLVRNNHQAFPLEIFWQEYGDNLPLQIEFIYHKAYFSQDEMKFFADRFLYILEQCALHPEVQLKKMEILPPKELALLEKYSNSKEVYTSDDTVMSVFAQQVEANPDAIALVAEDEKMTYSELATLSDAMAVQLQKKGVTPGMPVILCMERTPQLMVAILAILKTGAAYVPVEPDIPAERLTVLMTEVSGEIIVTTSHYASRFSASEVICLDAMEIISGQMPAVSVSDIDMAYIMFTSGSTGRPKGVMAAHRNIVSLIKAQEYFPITSDDCILAGGSFAFDASTFEYWGALLNGGTLVMATKAELMDTTQLKSIIKTQGVTKMFFTTGWFNLLADTDVTVFETLKAVIVGGERFSATHGLKVREHCTTLQIVNGYGPTENTTFSLAYLTNNTVSEDVPIGLPLNYRSAYILNKEQKQVPIGITGELYVGGAGLTKGYYQRPELTQASFIPDVFENDSEKLYRTGDLVRCLPDGNVVFVGRTDDQVKIRGFRIEPAEVTAVLLQSSMIQQAVVIARPDATGILQLIAYVVDSENTFDKEILVQWLETKLPGYMIPAHIILMEKLPLNANGKVDRNALPVPENNTLQIVEKPRNATEIRLAEIWQELLRVSQVGIRDNFFHLGGHSLMAMRVSAFIKNEWGLRVAPTVLFTCKTIERLAAHINHLQQRETKDNQHSIETYPTDRLPLSFGQERMWFLDRLQGSVQYHIISALKLKGNLDVSVLEKALGHIVDRHESLRTTIRLDDGVPYQHILEKNTWKIDIQQNDSQDLDDEGLQSLTDELIAQPFDLSQDHMLRAHLIPLSSDQHILLMTIHHIAADGWSLSVLSKELEMGYQAYLNGKEPALPALAVQYKDYSIWQRRHESAFTDQLEYWKNKLNGLVSLNMPTDYIRSPKQSIQGDSMKFRVGKELTEKLKSFSVKEDVTLYMTLLTAFKVVLHKYASQDDICVGGAISGRLEQEFEPLIGFFVNTLALRTDFGGQPNFPEALHRVKNTLLEAYDHQEVPFEKIVGQIQGDRDTSRNPLFQIVFVLQNAPDAEVSSLDQVTVEPIHHRYRTSQFDLHFSIHETSDGLLADVVYCTDLFKASTIERLLIHFENILQSVVLTPHIPINRMNMLSDAETHEIVHSFSGAPATYPKEQTIVGLFTDQVKRTPDRIAVSYEGNHMTYKTLDEQSTMLARRLKLEGVEKGTLVPICTGHCLEMMVGILGILKAGGVYIPVDPEYPEDRIHFILNDTKAPVVLVLENTLSVIRDIYSSGYICLDSDWKIIEEHIELPDCDPEQAAYIIYTSGSTGRPKGVIIPHRNVVRLFITSDPLFDFNEHDVWTMFHSYCFDFSVWEMYGALFYGGRVVIVPRNTARDTMAFTRLLINEGVTVLNQTPSAFYVLQEYVLLNPVPLNIRYVIFGGEALHPMRLKGWHSQFTNCKLINMYGITETTVHVTYQEITEKEMNGSGSVIGKPIPTLRAYILDKDLQPVPIGVPGELCIAGEGVATGYLNREELTAERFVKDPFSKNENEKLYRAGDLGKWLEDGTIEYLGRIDHQVKIRGYRIELGEIEHVVNKLPEVAESCVVVKSSQDQADKKLVCYYVPEISIVKHWGQSLGCNIDNTGIGNEEVMMMIEKQIRQGLANTIPEYMIPTDIIALEQMPVTSNGKTDRGLLTQLEDQKRTQNTGYEPPVSTMEVLLVDIWQELLNIERVGVLDNFFEIGGDSIRVVKVAARIKNRTGIEIGVADIYGARTIRELALLLENTNDDSENDIRSEIDQELIDLEQKYLPLLGTGKDLESVYPMTSIQNGMIYASLRDPGAAVYHDQFLYPVNRKVNKPLFEKALKLMVDKHETFRTTFHLGLHETGLQAVSRNMSVEVEELDLSDQDINGVKHYLKTYLEKERIISFDIQEGPLWRAALLHWQEGTVFILQFHHAILDGWSVAAFNTELFNLYLRLQKNNEAKPLLKLNGHYRDFVKEEMSRKKQAADHTFWLSEMEDHQRLDIFTEEDVYENTVAGYDVEVLHHLKDVAKKHGISLKGVFLGISLYVTSMLSYRRKITIGLVANNRPIVEDGDQLLGCFLNTIPFVFEMPEPGMTWITYFREIDQKLKQLEIHDRTPLAEIARINGESSPKENPFFDVLFNFINFHIYDQLEKDLVNVQLGKESLTDTSFGVANTFLNFSISLTGDDMKVVFSLSRMLQSGKTTQDLQYYFDYVLNCFRHQADQKIDKQLLLPVQEQELLIKELNNTGAAFSKDLTLSSCFDTTAEIYPDKIALIASEKEYSYYTLQRWVDRIATLLINEGVKPGMYIPLMADRTAHTVASILAIMKVGAAYVPIDPKMPENRVSMILNDTQATIVAGHQIPEYQLAPEIKFVNTTEASHVVETAVFPSFSSSSYAYVIYTSGSTGVPKGVPVKHKSVINLIEGCSKQLGFTSDEYALQFTNFTFDASVEVLFLSLLKGAALVVPTDEILHDPDLFCQSIEAQQITHLVLTPGFLQSLGHVQLSHSLKRIIVGGEECPPALASYWSQYVEFYNEYGPTETTVTATRYRYIAGSLKKVPIGKPIQNASVYILDELQQLLPKGVPGEICISGEGVTDGYLHRPDLTEQKFIPNLFNEVSGAVLYRTGDIGRWLSDGNLEYQHRADNQVKVRGYRIELGEIESVLLQHSEIRQAAVLVQTDKQNDNRLIAYVSLVDGMSEEEIISYLREQLPYYMIPAHVHIVPQIPLTISGKVDRNALSIDAPKDYETRKLILPENATEKILKDIWVELLGTHEISTDDDFFALGGHSLTILQLLSRIREKGYEVQLSEILSHTTIAEQAIFLMNEQKDPVQQEKLIHNGHIRLLNKSRHSQKIFLLPGSNGNCDGYDELAAAMAPLGSVYGIQMMGVMEEEKPLEDMKEIAKLQLKWVQEIQPTGPYQFIAHSFGGHALFEMIKQLEQMGEKVEMAAILDVATTLPDFFFDADYLMEFVMDSLTKYGLLTTSEPEWKDDLKMELTNLISKNKIPNISEFMKSRMLLNNDNAGLILRIIDLNIANMMLGYKIEGTVDTPFILIKAMDGPASHQLPALGWENHTTSVQVEEVEGGHFTMLYKNFATEIASLLQQFISELTE